MDDDTLQRSLRARPPADPTYRPRLTSPRATIARAASTRLVRLYPHQPTLTRFQTMNATLKIAAVAVLALAVGIGAVQLQPSTNNMGSNPSSAGGATEATGAPVAPVTIGFANFGTGNWFTDAVGNGVKKAATAAGVRLLAADGGWDGYTQATQIEDFVTQSVDAILVVPWDPASIASAVEAADAAGIPVLAIDRTVEGAPIASLIASDSVTGSRMAGEYLFKAMGGSGKVIEVQGDPAWTTPRAEGFKQALDAAPSITLAGQDNVFGDPNVAKSVTGILLKANPDVTGAFAHTDDMAVGAAAAIADRGLTDKVKLVGFDGSPDGLVAVRDGSLAATVAQQPMLMGQKAVETAIQAAAGEAVDGFVPVETVLVTSANVDQFLAPAAPLPSPANE